MYVPNKAEQEDPHLYADNVRAAMLRFGNFKPSDSNLVECRAYIALLQGASPALDIRGSSYASGTGCTEPCLTSIGQGVSKALL